MYVIALFQRVALALYTTFIHAVPPTDPDIVRFVLNTTLSMHVSKLESETSGAGRGVDVEVFKFAFRGCLLESVAGDRLESMELTFTLHGKDLLELETVHDPLRQHRRSRLMSCVINRKPVADRGLIMGALNVFLVAGIHPKIHTASAPLARFIEEQNIDELKPSLAVTSSLHTTLLTTSFSPIAENKWLTGSWIYMIPVTTNSLVAQSLNWEDFRHEGQLLLRGISPFCSFLWDARKSCLRHVRHDRLSEEEVDNATPAVNLPPFHAECFFLTTVVHAADHYNAHKFSWWLKYPLHYNEELVQSGIMRQFYSFTCAGFRYSFEAPTLNPLRPNLMQGMPVDSVYGRIYDDLKKVNKELADCITASIMY